MKKLAILGALVVLLASLTVVTPAAADPPAWMTFEFPGGSLTTSNLNPWSGVNGLTYPVAFDVDAAGIGNLGLRLYVYDLDMSQIIYEGSWGWPVTPDDLGGLAMAGITGSTVVEFDRQNAAWFQLHSALGTENTWEQGTAPWDPVDQTNYRKYLLQAWHRGLTGEKVFPDGPNNHQYNVERHMGPSGRTEPVCAGYLPDPEYDTFDLQIDFTPLGGGQYKMEGWIRLHKASSWDEMVCKPHPFKWQWNAAMNNDGQPNPAWLKIGGHMPPAQQYRTISNADFSAAFPFLNIANWGTTQTNFHTVTWGKVVVAGVPVVPTVVWVDDGWTGTFPGTEVAPGQYFGYNAFAKVQDGVNAVASGGTVHVAAGTYSEGVTLTPGKDLTIAGAGRDVVTWICPSGGYCIDGSMSGYTGSMSYEISGFTFNVRSDPGTEWGAGIGIRRASNGPLSLSIHDNRFVEDRESGDDTHWATSMLLCHNRYAARDGSGNAAVRVYNNIDETWGGMTMSNSQAYDIYDNVFDGCSDAIYNGHGCPDVAGQTFGDHHIYGNTFMNASDALHPGGLTPAIDWQYYGAGGGTHLPSIIESNLFKYNDTAIRFIMDTDMTYPAHVVTNNNFVDNDFAVRVDGTFAGPLDARCNWWGAVDGPSGVGPGSGDPVSDNVAFQPWLTQEAPSACDYEGPLTHNVAPATVAVNTPVILTANVDDTTTGGSNIASAEYNLDDGGWVAMSAQDGSFFDEVVEDVEASIPAFTEVGIHGVCVRGTDAAGNTGPEECTLLVVYDPEGGFVTGGGWIWSPAGAYYPDGTLEGKATFGFVSKYRKGAQIPEGQTEFVFKVADLNFHSDNYEWLVVAGAKAQFKGTGTINDAGNYGFMLTAIDAELTPSTEVDKFRIKIWDKDADEIVYDNQIDAADDADLTTEIGGGSIVIHTSKK